jgi:hypothetical protein
MSDNTMNNSGILNYDRQSALDYAQKWALKRNPQYYDFEPLGGDCTNFASQVIFAGSGIMNYTRVTGWFYQNQDNRSPSWTGVSYLYNFLTGNHNSGPFATLSTIYDVLAGDILQMAFDGGPFQHSCIIVNKKEQKLLPPQIFIAAHSYNTYNEPLSNYDYSNIRFLHIEGVKR